MRDHGALLRGLRKIGTVPDGFETACTEKKLIFDRKSRKSRISVDCAS
jgi:hypothetical protein